VVRPGVANNAYAYRVDWGDGSESTGAGATSPATGLVHAYGAGGPYAITVAVDDGDPGGTGAAAAAPVSFLYALSGFLPPVDNRATNVWPAARTVPVKVRITDCDGRPVSGLAPRVGTAGPGQPMRFSQDDGIYIFNLALRTVAGSTLSVTGTDAAGAVVTAPGAVQATFRSR